MGRLFPVGFVIVFFARSVAAFTCTDNYDSIEFTINAPTTFSHAPEPGSPYWEYSAEMTPGDEVVIDVTAPGNTNPTNAGCAIWQRYIQVGPRVCTWAANESFSCGGGMIFFPRKGLPYVPIYYQCNVFQCPPNGQNGAGATIMARIWTATPIQYSPGYFPDLRGHPDASFSHAEPPTGTGPTPAPPKPPDGPGPCSPIGLPGFRINMATLNLFLQDREFAYSTVGPRMDFVRSYNFLAVSERNVRQLLVVFVRSMAWRMP